MTDHTTLRLAIRKIRDIRKFDISDPGLRVHAERIVTLNDLVALADAAESTLPKTRTVEVWHVHSAIKHGTWRPHVRAFATEAEARRFAMSVEVHPARRNVRVTGPHQQEIPV